MEKQWSRITVVKMRKKMRQTLPGSSRVSVRKQVCGKYRWVMSLCHEAPYWHANRSLHRMPPDRFWGKGLRRESAKIPAIPNSSGATTFPWLLREPFFSSGRIQGPTADPAVSSLPTQEFPHPRPWEIYFQWVTNNPRASTSRNL